MNFTDETMERIRAVAIVVLLAAMAHAVGCKSAPIAPYNDTVAQINATLAELKKDPIKNASQIKTLEASKKEIVELSANSASDSKWAIASKAVLAAGMIFIIAAIALKLLIKK